VDFDRGELGFEANQVPRFSERRLFRSQCLRIIAALMELGMSFATPNT